ncbi:MAG: ABC transporter substrate-binding protein [Bacilli bacterium]|nr:ABC transporter substrate-binding protein [Bacilli bacterium]
MKITKTLLLFTGVGLVAPLIASCGSGTPVGGADTVQIRAYKAGFGVDWLYELKDQFEKTFPGKKIEIVEASALVGEASINEIKTPGKNQIDLYFLSDGHVSDVVSSSAGILRKKDKCLYEDLTDVFNSKAIGFDGKEESETIASRMYNGYKDYSTYVGYVTQFTGKMYTIPWADSVLGITANPSVLNKFNIDYKDILTSNDLKTAIETIYNAHKKETIDGKEIELKPYSWAGNNAPGYWTYLFETWFSQYSGVSKYEDFMRCTPNHDGKFYEKGYEVYKDEGILKSLQAMDSILDLNYSPAGSSGMKHTDAQTDFIKGKTAFMVSGDWMLKEMSTTEAYFNLTKECVMMKTPIISELGTKIGLTEENLKKIIKLIDAQGKTADNEAIKKEVSGVTDEQINTVREARSTHDSLGVSHNIVVPSYSDALPLTKQFIRFMYSNDGCRVCRNKGYMNLPVSYKTEAGDSTSTFQSSVDEAYNFPEVHMISGAGELNDVRQMSKIILFNKSEWSHPNTFKTIMQSKFDGKPLAMDKIYNDEAEYMKLNWKSVFMTNGGYSGDY